MRFLYANMVNELAQWLLFAPGMAGELAVAMDESARLAAATKLMARARHQAARVARAYEHRAMARRYEEIYRAQLAGRDAASPWLSCRRDT